MKIDHAFHYKGFSTVVTKSLTPPPPKAVTSFMNDPLSRWEGHCLSNWVRLRHVVIKKRSSLNLDESCKKNRFTKVVAFFLPIKVYVGLRRKHIVIISNPIYVIRLVYGYYKHKFVVLVIFEYLFLEPECQFLIWLVVFNKHYK